MPNAIVKSKVLSRYCAFVRKHNGDPLFLLDRVGINENVLNGFFYIPHKKVAELFNLTAKEINMPLFGLIYAKELEDIHLSNLEFFYSFQSNLDGVFVFLKKHLYLQTDAFDFTRVDKSGQTHVEIFFSFGHEIETWQLSALTVMRMIRSFKLLLGEKIDASQLIVELPYLGPKISDDLGEGIRFSKKNNVSLIYPSFWNSFIISPNTKDIMFITNDFLEREKKIRPQRFTESVNYVIRRRIKNNEICNVESVAKEFFMHVRTLQNKLKSECTTFMSEVNSCRFELAKKCLLDTGVSVHEISISLGFSDVSSFTRAFKLWSGITPTQWRDQYIFNNE